jgi:hypothetical protein
LISVIRRGNLSQRAPARQLLKEENNSVWKWDSIRFRYYLSGENTDSRRELQHKTSNSVKRIKHFNFSCLNIPNGLMDGVRIYDYALTAIEMAELANVSIPGTVWLLESGFIGLVGLRKKFKKI